MSQYPSNPGYLWDLPAKLNNSTDLPGPIFNKPENPVPEIIAWSSGEKVEHLEALEVAVQIELRKKHTYLTKVRGNYKLKKIIFHTQLIRNSNVRRGYPENRGLPDRPLRRSKRFPPPSKAQSLVLPDPEPEAILPPGVPLVVSAPRNFPWNFHWGVPRPIRYPANYIDSEEEEKPHPEYIYIPEPVSVSQPAVLEEENPTDFVEIGPLQLQQYSSYFDFDV